MRSTQLGGSRVWTIGKGPTVVVVHGGPGFDHAYIVPALLPLASQFRLVFYDQSRRGAITPATLTGQLRKILAALRGGPPIILAHSWGTYLAVASLAAPEAPAVSGVVLVSPVAPTLKRFNQATARFKKSLPTPAPAGMKELMPYYLAKQNRGMTSIPAPHLDAPAYRRIGAALQASNYDLRQAWRSLPETTHVVFGRQDRLSKPSDFAGLRRRLRATSIPGAAHFAFAEQPATFRRLFIKAFGQS